MLRRSIAVALTAAALIVTTALPALAGHDHFVETPNGKCHQIAYGQTAIDDPNQGGYHKFHQNVHIGATGEFNRALGKGNSPVNVYKGSCP